MDIIIRDFKEDDLDKVNEILKESFDAEKGISNESCFHEIVSVCDGEVSGYLLLTKVKNPIRDRLYCLVDYVCVSSKYRGTGASDKLMEYAYDVAKEMGASYLQLTCAPFRKSAHALYERCSFKKVDTDLYRKEIV